MTVSLLVIIFFVFISYFAGRLMSSKINLWPKKDRLIFIAFWTFVVGSIMLFLKWLQVSSAVGHTYYEAESIKDAKANFMQIYFVGCYVFSVITGLAFYFGLVSSKEKTI